MRGNRYNADVPPLFIARSRSMRRSCFLVPILLLLAGSAVADEIILKDGRKIYGEVRKEGDHIVVVDSQGTSTKRDGITSARFWRKTPATAGPAGPWGS